MQRSNLKKLKEVQGKEQYQFKISNRLAAFGNLGDDVDINRAWETIRENIKKISSRKGLGYYELKKRYVMV
jgi:hypothetical protein